MESSDLLTGRGAMPSSVKTGSLHHRRNVLGRWRNRNDCIPVQRQKPTKMREKKKGKKGWGWIRNQRTKKGYNRAKGRVRSRARHSADWMVRWGRNSEQKSEGAGWVEGCTKGSLESGSPLQAKPPLSLPLFLSDLKGL